MYQKAISFPLRVSVQDTIIFLIFACMLLFFPHTSHASLADGLVGHWTFDGKDTVWTSATAATTLDKSGNGNTGTLTSMSRSTSVVTGKFGQALQFDGSDDYIDGVTPNISGTTSAFSVSVWIKTAGASSDYDGLVEWSDASNRRYGIDLDQTGDPLFVYATSSSVRFREATGANADDSKWHHLVGIYTDASTMPIVYMDTVSRNLGSEIAPAAPLGANDLKIGDLTGPTKKFGGTIDDVRIYNRALTASEVMQLYNQGGTKLGVTPTVTSTTTGLNRGLVGHWTFDGKDTVWTSATAATTLDKSGNGLTATLSNMSRSSSTVLGKAGQGFKFDGSNDYIRTSVNALLDLETARTVSLWMNVRDHTGSYAVAIAGGSLSCCGTEWYIAHDNQYSTNKIDVKHTGVTQQTSLKTISPNKWYYVTWTYDGTTSRLYIDGTLESSTAMAGPASEYSNDVHIGASEGATNLFPGTLDDIRIYNRALTASEVTQLYNQGATKLGVTPTTFSTASGRNNGLVAHWTFDGKDTVWTSATAATTLDKSGNGNTGTLTSMNQSTSTVPGKMGQGLKFDATNDYVDVSVGQSTTFTNAMWIYPTHNDAVPNDYGTLIAQSNFNGWYYVYSTNKMSWWFTTDHFSNTAMTPNKWHHVALVNNGGNALMYLNGVLDSSTIGSAPTMSVEYIGNDSSSEAFGGRIDDVRVYNRALSATEIYQLYKAGQSTAI